MAPDGEPVRFRLRLRYAKLGMARFSSHRDIARAFERALRRARAPIAYSKGFSPHPKISWVGAAPTGTESEAEYVELGLVREVDPGEFGVALGRALPGGLDVVESVPAGVESLPDRIDGSMWHIALSGLGTGDGRRRLRAAVAEALAAERIEIARLTKKGMRTVDVRPQLVSLRVGTEPVSDESPPGSVQVADGSWGASPDRFQPRGAEVPTSGEPCGILEAVVRQSTPTVRPDDVLSALRVVAALEPPVPARATRLAQGRLDDAGHLADPFGPDGPCEFCKEAGEQEQARLDVE